jgi:hypothetical protein
MAASMGDGLKRRGPLVLVALAAATLVAYFAGCAGARSNHDGQQAPAVSDRQVSPTSRQDEGVESLGRNAGCYVCHMTFVGEELTVTHLETGHGCVACHGPSTGHANDENIGATPPDRVFRRDEINAFCRDCHPTHDVRPEAVVARWLKRNRERTIAPAQAEAPTCTDCHGQHRIAELEQAFP